MGLTEGIYGGTFEFLHLRIPNPMFFVFYFYLVFVLFMSCLLSLSEKSNIIFKIISTISTVFFVKNV